MTEFDDSAVRLLFFGWLIWLDLEGKKEEKKQRAKWQMKELMCSCIAAKFSSKKNKNKIK